MMTLSEIRVRHHSILCSILSTRYYHIKITPMGIKRAKGMEWAREKNLAECTEKNQGESCNTGSWYIAFCIQYSDEICFARELFAHVAPVYTSYLYLDPKIGARNTTLHLSCLPPMSVRRLIISDAPTPPPPPPPSLRFQLMNCR